MTIGETISVEGFDALLSISGRAITSDSLGTFAALVEDADITDSDFLLGQDPRELLRIHAIRSSVTNQVTMQQVLSLEDGTQLKVVRRVDSPGSPFIRFYASKITGKDS
jgi:hypothetical protein